MHWKILKMSHQVFLTDQQYHNIVCLWIQLQLKLNSCEGVETSLLLLSTVLVRKLETTITHESYASVVVYKNIT